MQGVRTHVQDGDDCGTIASLYEPVGACDSPIPVRGSFGLLRQALPRELASGPSPDVLSLATSGGVTEAGPAMHPCFFAGFLAGPGPAAQALLATAAIARAHYHVAAATVRMLRDPVVTSNTDRLRFESFSTCCGIHARLDLPPSALSTLPVTSGTAPAPRCGPCPPAPRSRWPPPRDRVPPASPGRSGWPSSVRCSGSLASCAFTLPRNPAGCRKADLGKEWTPRELRHTFVSLLSDNGMAIEEISRLVGHSSSNVTETIYRHQIRPVITVGAEAMDKIFASEQ